MDAWDGYRANRDRIAAALGTARNGVVLTGDVHRHWAAEVKANADQPDSPGAGVELVTTSITSTGDGDESTNSTVLGENPHLKFLKNRRGYVRTTFTASELRTDFRVLPYVRTPDAPVSTAAGFVTQDREPTLHPV
jgi:alkaline phosphatase D